MNSNIILNRVYFRYRLLTFSISVRHRYSSIFTLKYQYRTSTDRYRTVPYQVYSVLVHTFGDFR
ncbi:hypothetical protein HanRHA438_Chr17g0831761 [Helianthus annuus]|nr:hypothetical protein HanRHA438_Chr17g0831761 [Helianthus annuus]